jgi:hypothetical protein
LLVIGAFSNVPFIFEGVIRLKLIMDELNYPRLTRPSFEKWELSKHKIFTPGVTDNAVFFRVPVCEE